MQQQPNPPSGVNRRDFLTVSAAGAAGTALALNAATYAQVRGANERIGIAFLGIGEDPPGSNCNGITRWYGQGCIPWAAAAVSKACFDAGFNDGAGHWAMPGIAARTEHGFAWVADLRRAFEVCRVGR